ncbi:conserved hypothetical protein [Candida dubliniensis CD36]|uniref:Uncharacterized protein n=1 Tax=Candida dubliniensis (strain CD36 / ATCC MYA-646 / CBS 7987 / NCPF 3949 / NRRL Y-17841) TaxID=573826 RepID=B9WL72_CANDC|nr:conserved hypothetical protein [Candida dubliniensis CD36]CAX39777.1 conserved hypothetical protein [Candida dubliniensis CD36]
MSLSKPTTPVSSPKAQKALPIVVQEPPPQPTTPPSPQKPQTTFFHRQTKRSSSSFLSTPDQEQQQQQQQVSGVKDKESNLDSHVPSLPYTPSSKRRSYGIFESPVGKSPYGVALRTPRNEDNDSPEQRSKRYGIVERDDDDDDDDEDQGHSGYTPVGSGGGGNEDEEARRLKLQRTPQFHSAKRLYDTLNSVMLNNQNSAHNRYMNGIINSGNGQSISDNSNNSLSNINKSPNLKSSRHSWSANVNLQFSPPRPQSQFSQHKLPPPPPQPKFTPLTSNEQQNQNPNQIRENQIPPSWSLSSTPVTTSISPVYLPPQSSPTKLIIEPNDEEISAKDAIRKIIQKNRHSGVNNNKDNERPASTSTTDAADAAAARTLNFKNRTKHSRNDSYSTKDETEAAFSLVKLHTAAGGDDGDDTEDETEDDKE